MKEKLFTVIGILVFCSAAVPSFAGEAVTDFAKRCATCHGRDAGGNPAMAKIFKIAPASLDLTREEVLAPHKKP